MIRPAGIALLLLGACAAPESEVAAIEPPSEAEVACIAAVKAETLTEGQVVVMGSDVSEASTVVTLGVPDAAAPWACRTSNDGIVEEVWFTGSEGKA